MITEIIMCIVFVIYLFLGLVAAIMIGGLGTLIIEETYEKMKERNK